MFFFGCIMAFGGYRAIKKRSAVSDIGEHEGDSAVKLGWFWVVFGAIIILAVVFDIRIIKSAILFFFES